MLAAQAQAVTAQGFPPLKRFSGENVSTYDENFERWLEQLEEQVRIASCSKDQQLSQLKMHLEGTALQVFRMLPEKEKVTYDATVRRRASVLTKSSSSFIRRYKPMNVLSSWR